MFFFFFNNSHSLTSRNLYYFVVIYSFDSQIWCFVQITLFPYKQMTFLWLLKCWWASKRMYFHWHICSVWPFIPYSYMFYLYLFSQYTLVVTFECLFISCLTVECYWIWLTDGFTYINEFKIIQPYGYVIQIIDWCWSWTWVCKAYYHSLRWYRSISQSICKLHVI